MTDGNVLDVGDRFPDVRFDGIDGASIEIPGGREDRWTVLLVYRGHW